MKRKLKWIVPTLLVACLLLFVVPKLLAVLCVFAGGLMLFSGFKTHYTGRGRTEAEARQDIERQKRSEGLDFVVGVALLLVSFGLFRWQESLHDWWRSARYAWGHPVETAVADGMPLDEFKRLLDSRKDTPERLVYDRIARAGENGAGYFDALVDAGWFHAHWLSSAIRESNVPRVRRLLDAGADAHNGFGQTPPIVQAAQQYLWTRSDEKALAPARAEIFRLLIEHGADGSLTEHTREAVARLLHEELRRDVAERYPGFFYERYLAAEKEHEGLEIRCRHGEDPLEDLVDTAIDIWGPPWIGCGEFLLTLEGRRRGVSAERVPPAVRTALEQKLSARLRHLRALRLREADGQWVFEPGADGSVQPLLPEEPHFVQKLVHQATRYGAVEVPDGFWFVLTDLKETDGIGYFGVVTEDLWRSSESSAGARSQRYGPFGDSVDLPAELLPPSCHESGGPVWPEALHWRIALPAESCR